jgi:UDP-glucose-4-epimerase GalE
LKIFVTGGAGFIGSHTTRFLLDKGHEVTVYDNLSRGRKEFVDRQAKFIQGDTTDKEALLKGLPGHDAVIHMAGFIEVSQSFKDPESFFKNNLSGGVTLLEAMREAGIPKIIFSSTAAIYKPKDRPLEEDDPKEPQNPYGATKLSFENFLAAYFYSYKLESVSLRYFNAYGPFEHHKPETHAIPNFICATLKRKPVPLYWQGEQVRDYIFIDDLVEAHIKALNLSGLNYINLGTGKGTKTIDLLKMTFDLTGLKAPIADLGKREGDVPILVASYKKAKEVLGWEPKTPLVSGLKKTIEYFKRSQTS